MNFGALAAALGADWWWGLWTRPRGLDFLRALFPIVYRLEDEDGEPQHCERPGFWRKTVRGTTPPSKRSLKGGRRK